MDRVVVVSQKSDDWGRLKEQCPNNANVERLYYDKGGKRCAGDQGNNWQLCVQYGAAISLAPIKHTLQTQEADRFFVLVHGNQSLTPDRVRGELVGFENTPVTGPFTHQTGDLYWEKWKPVVDAILSENANNFQASIEGLIRILNDVPGRLYQAVIGLLSLFLPMDLALQLEQSGPNDCRFPSSEAINWSEKKIYALLKEAELPDDPNEDTPEKTLGRLLKAISLNEQWSKECPKDKFDAFHQAFQDLREGLFGFLEKVEAKVGIDCGPGRTC